MTVVDQASRRPVAMAFALLIALAGCEPTLRPLPAPSTNVSPTAAATVPPNASPEPQSGGTITILADAEGLGQIDPQRVYAQEDLAFLGATIYRSLEAFIPSADAIRATTLVPDLATDLGRPSDGGRTWAFTLRDGVSFQTGDRITCGDIRYAVSRSFANNVINEGPTYAIQYLDIPPATEADASQGFLSHYHGPYASTPGRQALFDKAVECSADGRTITFHLNRPVADFNAATTLGFFPVPAAADTGETYGTTADSLPVSSGPYMVASYSTGENGRLRLVRNPSWDPRSDPIRKAYPDRWEIEFGVALQTITSRLEASAGSDAFAVSYGPLDRDALPRIFTDATTPMPAFQSRAASGFDPFVLYYWINVQRVPNLKIRQAILVALDRQAILRLRGGDLSGTLADGVLKPSIGIDYAPTGLWTDFFGENVPDTGDPALAKRLIRESGETPGTLTFMAPDTPVNEKTVNVVIDSLAKAGLTVKYDPPCTGYGCGIFFDQKKAAAFGTGGWAADWPNASTVLRPLFTDDGGWNLSQVEDAAFSASIDDARATLNRGEQAAKWQALNRQTVENAWVIPMTFSREQRLAGTNVGPIYIWPAYGSWPYAAMHVN